ncbi:MAG TPA: aspartate/glutamate racemase family protein [Candidatus Saccharimonadales bacterium]|nr:aspartate/glutamate racemase family protein [Candidatus Saccharimonadales bacterium]
MKVGVFDSGVGGLSMANAVHTALPGVEVILRQDKEHVPYGLRQPPELLRLVTPIFQELVDEGCRVIVVACNTVTTTLIKDLRERFNVPLIAVEPMIKPAAALTKTGVIAVCATPTTLASPRYAELKAEFAQGITVLEPDCSDWPAMIEHKQVDEAAVEERINEVLARNADVIVLACTHYHWIEDEIKGLAGGRAQVIQPEQATIEQLKQVLGRLS